MKTCLRFSIFVAVAVFAVGFSPKSNAQCDVGLYSNGFSFEFRSQRGFYESDSRYYDSHRHYDDDCDYRSGYFDNDYDRYDRREVPVRRRVIRVYPDGRAVRIDGQQERLRENLLPVAPTRRAANPQSQTPSGKDVRGGSVSPYLNDGKAAPNTRTTQPNQTGTSFQLELPDPAPRQNRTTERIPAPKVPSPPAAPEQVRNSPADSAKFPVDLVIANSDDEFVTVSEIIGDNKAVLIDFWASWCGPCIKSMPDLKRRAEGLKPYGIAVAGMNVESDVAIAKRIQKQHGMESVTWLVEPKSQPFSKAFKIDSIPQVMLIDPSGKVLFKGFPNDRGLETALEELVGDGN